MMASGELLAWREQRIQVTAPARRILARAEPLGPRRIQHPFDPAAQSRGSFGYLLPDRLKHPQHLCGLDHVDRHRADRLGVSGQRHRPLAAVFLVAPFARHARHELIGALAEGRHSPSGFARLDRVFALGEGGPTPLGKPAGFGQVHPGEATEAHFLERPAEPEQEDPALGPALIDDEIEATAIGMAAGFFDRRYRPRTQSIELLAISPHPNIYPNARHGL